MEQLVTKKTIYDVVKFGVTALTLLTLVACQKYQGARGYTGAQGPAGQDGSSCSVMELPNNEGALVQCTNGTSVVITNGTNGTDGAVGQKGDTGPAGQNATPVTMVKLCPEAGSYPSTFPEYAFDFAGTLYATYWDGHNAWTSELYPGSYSSTSTSAPCNFTVNADGTITH